jgi:hypothetical protein
MLETANNCEVEWFLERGTLKLERSVSEVVTMAEFSAYFRGKAGGFHSRDLSKDQIATLGGLVVGRKRTLG